MGDVFAGPPHAPGRDLGAGPISLATAAAAALGLTALTVVGRARKAERDNPPGGKFVDVDSVRLHYLEKGSGPPLVLLHGNGTMAQDFAISGLFDRLAADYRVVAFDRPGFGYSERPRSRVWTASAQAELIAQAMRRIGMRDAVIAAHSWGTLVALAIALDHPGAVRGLALLGGYYFPSWRLDVPVFAPPALPLVGDVLRYTVSPLLGRLLAPRIMRKVFAPMPVPERFAREFPVDLTLRPWQIRATAADAALMTPGAAALAPRYAELDVPVLIVAGARDEIGCTDKSGAADIFRSKGSGTWSITPPAIA